MTGGWSGVLGVISVVGAGLCCGIRVSGFPKKGCRVATCALARQQFAVVVLCRAACLHHAILLDIRVWLLMLTWIWLLVGRYCYVAATAAAGKACGKELGHRGMLLECNAKCHVQVLLDTFGCLLVH